MNIQGQYWNTLLSVPRPLYTGDPDVRALLHMDNNATDSSQYAHTFTNQNGVAYTATSKFGSHAANFTNANNTHLQASASTLLWDQLEGCIEMFVYFPSVVPSNNYYVGLHDNDGAPYLWFYTNEIPYFSFYFFGVLYIVTDITILPDTYYHVAMVRRLNGTDVSVYCYVNGQEYLMALNNTVLQSGTPTLDIGASPFLAGPSQGGRCYIDEFRYVVGRPVYNGAFTPPNAPFPNP